MFSLLLEGQYIKGLVHSNNKEINNELFEPHKLTDALSAMNEITLISIVLGSLSS